MSNGLLLVSYLPTMYEHTLVPFRDLLDRSYLMLWLHVLIPEIILCQKRHINYVKSYTCSISRKLMRKKNKQISFVAKYRTLFERTTCSFSVQPGMPVNWMPIMCQSNRIVLCMDCSINCDNTVCLASAQQTRLWSCGLGWQSCDQHDQSTEQGSGDGDMFYLHGWNGEVRQNVVSIVVY